MAENKNALPYGLCKRYGIELPEGATPRDAWDALKQRTGKSIDQLYDEVESKAEQKKAWDSTPEYREPRGRGYVGSSMSVNARDAYDSDEKPRSKWTKQEIVDEIKRLTGVDASKLTADELRVRYLKFAGWHHTGKYFNRTDFYSLDIPEELTQAEVDSIIAAREPRRRELKPKQRTMSAIVRFIEWAGTRNHPKRIEHQEVVHYKDDDKMVQTSVGNKRMTSLDFVAEVEGMHNEDEIRAIDQKNKEKKIAQEKKEMQAKTDSMKAKRWIGKNYPKISTSTSGAIYVSGRKPTPFDYDRGLDKFFKKGESRLVARDGKYVLQTWNGTGWDTLD